MMIGVLFLDVAKAFDTVDHSILLSKLPSYGLSSSTINWLTSYLSDRTHSTTINGATSTPLTIKCGVPQGSILGPNLFSIHINDLPSICPSNTTTVLFADDATIYVIGSTVPEISHTLSSVLKDCHNWMSSNNLQLNINKTKCMLIHQSKRQTRPPNVSLNNSQIDQVNSFKLLGCIINHHLSWDDHIQHITVKVTRSINLLRRMSWFLPKKILLMFYKSYILPTLDYCDTVWSSGFTATQALKLERLQNYACRIILKQPRIASATQLRSILNLPTLKSRRDLHSVTQVYKCLNNLDPGYLRPLIMKTSTVHHHYTRLSSTNSLQLPLPSTSYGKKVFSFSGPLTWNSLPADIKEASSLSSFTRAAQSHVLKTT